MDRWTRRSFLAAGLSLGACTHLDKPLLGALYRPTQQTLDQPPLVVIPGMFGSRLRDVRTGHVIWPGSSAELVVSDFRALEVEIDPATLEPCAGLVEAYDIFETALGRDFYRQMLGMLEKVGGYVRCGPCSKARADRRNFYVYPYDFRLDNVQAARGLHELIERIRADYGDPRQPVDVLAHSNGGLLARYYARYGTADLPDSGPFAPVGAGVHSIRLLLRRDTQPGDDAAGPRAPAWRGNGPAPTTPGALPRALRRHPFPLATPATRAGNSLRDCRSPSAGRRKRPAQMARSR